jgi:pyruvate/2-oxoglutarate/acetoin dehydrogenase E1 component
MVTVLSALNQGLARCLESSEQVYFLGEDILDPYGGAFKAARGLSSAYPDHVITSPVSEAGLVGIGVGMALRGLRPIVEIMFGDFLLLGADQWVNHATKLRWMSADQVRVPIVVRTPMGGYRGYGPTHSQTFEKHVLGAAGGRVVAVHTLQDPGQTLWNAVFEIEDPVLFIEHKALYPQNLFPWDSPGDFDIVSDDGLMPSYRIRIAGAPPSQLTIVTYGYMGELARAALKRLAYEREVFADLVLFTELIPQDPQLLMESLFSTRRLLTVEEGTRTLGWGAEIGSRIIETLPDTRLKRVAAKDMPVPAAQTLETAMLPGVEEIIDGAFWLTGVD